MGVPVKAIWSDSFTTVTSSCNKSAPVEQIVARLSQMLVNKVNKNYSFDPPLTVDEMQLKYYPPVNQSADILSIGGTNGLTITVRPADATVTGQRWIALNGEVEELKKKKDESPTSTELLMALQTAVAKMQEDMKKDKQEHQAEQKRHEEELKKEKEERQAEQKRHEEELKKEREERKAAVKKEREERITEQERLEEERATEKSAQDDVIKELREKSKKDKKELTDSLKFTSELTVKLVPLHLRILLDLGRQRVLEITQSRSWDDFRGNRSTHDLTDVIMRTLVQANIQYCPSRDAVDFLCTYNNVRREGNYRAHNASQAELRDAVTTKPIESQDRLFLEQLYQFIFKCSL